MPSGSATLELPEPVGEARPRAAVASRRSLLAGPAVAVVTFAAAVWATQEAGIPLRDPDHVAGRRLLLVIGLVLVLVALDVAVRAGRAAGTWRPSKAAMLGVRRERWTAGRGVATASALVSFYVSYLAYRNIKSMVPLLRPDELFDLQLADADRFLFFGQDPAALLHGLLGTGVAAHVLSVVYVFYVIFVPISLALAVVYSANLPGGLFYTVALAINWPLGAACYLLLPALGPVFITPSEFAALPTTGASSLQALLLDDRIAFLRDPGADGASQGIAAFASVHTSMVLTAALAAHLLGVPRRVKMALWLLVAGTVLATIHLGWHYVVDDLAGVLIAVVSIGAALALTGFRRQGTLTQP